MLAAAAPLAVSAPPQHATEIRIAGGSGSYAIVARGCEGEGGGEPTRYASPFVSFDWPGVSIGAGWVHGDRAFPDDEGATFKDAASGHVRFGKPKFYVSASYLEAVPLMTS
ncbi:MAG TPA: hypothetical protein VIX13_03635, partial [Candidatus Eisenbacteria bacterium]